MEIQSVTTGGAGVLITMTDSTVVEIRISDKVIEASLIKEEGIASSAFAQWKKA